jgi:molecular chaperone Hsp33
MQMDIIRPFMLKDGLFRGCFIEIEKTFQDIVQNQKYPDSVASFLKQGILLALALAGSIKYEGVFSLQIKGDGPLSNLFVDVTHDKKVRASVSYDKKALPKSGAPLADFFGAAQLIFSVAMIGQQPYQGVVLLTHRDLVSAVMDYFKLSEQIDTDIFLLENAGQGACFLLQKMPDNNKFLPAEQTGLWEELSVLMRSMTPGEVFDQNLSDEQILYRVFHAHDLVVFPSVTPEFSCRCYRGKMHHFLQTLSPAEREGLYKNGKITAACQFCGTKYVFEREDFA